MYPGASTAGPGEALAAFPRATRGAFFALGFRTRLPRGGAGGGGARGAVSGPSRRCAAGPEEHAGGEGGKRGPGRGRRGHAVGRRARAALGTASLRPPRGVAFLRCPLPLPGGRGRGLCPLGAAPQRGGGRRGRPCPRLCATCRPPSPRRARLFCQLGLLPRGVPGVSRFLAPIRCAVLRRTGAGGERRTAALLPGFLVEMGVKTVSTCRVGLEGAADLKAVCSASESGDECEQQDGH